MSRLQLVALLAVALTLGACADSSSPSAPATDGDGLTLQLDQRATPSDDGVSAETSAAPELGTAGQGHRTGVTTATVSCVHNAWQEMCLDIRSGVLRGAGADAIVNKNNFSTRGQLKINGLLVAQTNRFGPSFIGDEIFASYTRLSFRVFRGDKVCHAFPGATATVCGIVR
jgi:hypothetical protein